MRARERLSCAVGNIFNDIFRQLLVSFDLVFFMKVLKLSAVEAGLIVVVGQITDALSSPITGYLADRVNVPFISEKLGRRKSWHLLGTVFVAIGLPLLLNRCFLCAGRDQSWLPLFYFGFFSALANMCYNIVEINHLAFITSIAESVEECAALSAMRAVFSFLSGVYVYAIAWGLLGQDSGDTLGPNNFSEFVYLAWIATGTGVFFATIFHISTKEPKRRVRKQSTYSDVMNAPGVFMPPFRSEDVAATKTSLAYTFVEMIMASSDYGRYEQELDRREKIQGQEFGKRKRSLLQMFVGAVFFDKELNSGHSQSQTDTEETTNNPDSEDTKTSMAFEVQHLDRDRKKSQLEHVFDRLLRLQRDQKELTDGSIEDQVAAGSADDEYITGNHYRRQEGIGNVPSEDKWKTHNSVNVVIGKHPNKKAVTDRKDQNEDIPETSACNQRRQRKHAVVAISNGEKHGLPNWGFESDRSDDAESENVGVTSVRQPKKSVTCSHAQSLNEKRQQKLNLEDLSGKETILDETTQRYPTQHRSEDKRIESSESSALEDNLDTLGLPVSSSIYPPEEKCLKRVKDWLRDPNLYKVAIIFTCSRLAQDAVYGYLPLFLTERQLFPKEAIAYFPLILLISASVASSICYKLNRKIGSKWSYLLGGSLVIGGAVWCYFQTNSTRQSTYAPMVIIGSGLSIMDVISLVFITDLIGENKETSGSVFAFIIVISRLSSGGLIFGIQEFYPGEGASSNEAISNYVRHVFAMVPGMLTLVALLFVLVFQPSKISCKTSKASQDVEAEVDQPSLDVRDPQCPPENKATPNVNSVMARVHSCSEDTKL